MVKQIASAIGQVEFSYPVYGRFKENIYWQSPGDHFPNSIEVKYGDHFPNSIESKVRRSFPLLN